MDEPDRPGLWPPLAVVTAKGVVVEKALRAPLSLVRRFSQEDVARQVEKFAASPAAPIFDNLPQSVVVFNASRQIVYANAPFRAMLPGEGTDDRRFLGRRLGEALTCPGADLGPDGCGTSELCRHCGASIALEALEGGQDEAEGECRINCERRQLASLDFRLHVWPLPQDGEALHAAVLTDTRAEKRLALMERIFYHDTLNLVSGMKGLCDLLRQAKSSPQQSELELLAFAVDRIADMILSQREFSQAERGEYEITSVRLQTRPFLEGIADLMRQQPTGRDKTLTVAAACANTTCITDRKLLARILVNMVKNALEATPAGGTVTAGCTAEAETIRFWVKNPGVIPQGAREQIFRRTFSTKGRGRGLGTYSIKLFTENYLEGHVGFTSTVAAGTEFFVVLPYAMGCRD